MLWDSGLEKLGQQWNQVWSAVEFYDAFAGPDGTMSNFCPIMLNLPNYTKDLNL